MRDTLRTRAQIVAAPQLIPAPAPLAWSSWPRSNPTKRCYNQALEPACSAKQSPPLNPKAQVYAVELNHRLLRSTFADHSPGPEDAAQGICTNILQGDFLECEGLGTFERIVVNPPFADGTMSGR